MRWLLKRGWMYAAMAAISAFALFPVYWVVITSLKPRSEIYTRTPDLWPSDPQWDQYPRVLGEGHVGRALVNSLIVAGGTMVICLIVGALAAYALARWRVRDHAHPADAGADDADVPARRARDPAVRDDAQGRAARAPTGA